MNSKAQVDPAGKLFRLSKTNKFEVSKNDLDVRGWSVIDLNGERLGKVTELIADAEAQKVRYLEVELDKDVASIDHSRLILIPIGITRLHKHDDNVLVENLNRSSIHTYPTYSGGIISRDYELNIRRALSIGAGSAASATVMPSAATTNTFDADTNRVQENRHFVETHQVSQTDIDQMRKDLETRRAHHDTHRQHYETSAADLRDHDSSRLNWDEYHNRDKESLINELKSVIAQRDIAIRERDIARAERDILRLERDNLISGRKHDQYDHTYFDDSKFYENRRRTNL